MACNKLDTIENHCRTLIPYLASLCFILICIAAVGTILNWHLFPTILNKIGIVSIIALLFATAACAMISMVLSVNRIADQLYNITNRLNDRIRHY